MGREVAAVRYEPCKAAFTRQLPELIGVDPGMQRLRGQMRAIASRHCTVLICGESGTGKELVARHIHALGPRSRGPFVTVDCTTLRDTLFESQLFGHVKGAFTGAEQATLGLFRAADGGTLLLDEIGELDLQIQAKLLRCVQENAVVPLGGHEPIPVDVRILVATHRDLAQMVRAGRFREDLFYRLNVVRLDVPPLRARPADTELLAEHFLAQHAERYQEGLKTLAPEARAALRAYTWPGNVRELRNVIEHSVVFADDDFIRLSRLPKHLRPAVLPGDSDELRRVVPLRVAERCLIKRALRAAKGNQSLAAQLLGIERHRLARLIVRHRLQSVAGPPRMCSA